MIDADFAMHLLGMCLERWQTQYNLTENSTPVSTRALLLVLKNIENNVELDAKPASTTKAKGAEQKRKMESEDSRIPKKPKKVGWTEKTAYYAKSMGACIKLTTLVTTTVTTRTVLQLRKMGAEASPIPKKGNWRA